MYFEHLRVPNEENTHTHTHIHTVRDERTDTKMCSHKNDDDSVKKGWIWMKNAERQIEEKRTQPMRWKQMITTFWLASIFIAQNVGRESAEISAHQPINMAWTSIFVYMCCLSVSMNEECMCLCVCDVWCFNRLLEVLVHSTTIGFITTTRSSHNLLLLTCFFLFLSLVLNRYCREKPLIEHTKEVSILFSPRWERVFLSRSIPIWKQPRKRMAHKNHETHSHR